MPQQRILLKGRLGNQMFIYAFARALNIRTGGETVLIDDWCQKKHVPCRLDCFNLSPEMKFGHGKGLGLLRRVVLKLAVLKLHNTKRCKRHTQELGMKPFLQKHGIFHIIDGYATLPENSLLQSRDFYMEGYFQSEKYFTDYKKEILADFRFRQSLKDSCQPIAQQIIEANEPVCLHVRLGDYVQHSLHGVANVDYYRRALSLLREQSRMPIFSSSPTTFHWQRKHWNWAMTSSVCPRLATISRLCISEAFASISLCPIPASRGGCNTFHRIPANWSLHPANGMHKTYQATSILTIGTS